jgi:hypothetical protein
MTVIGADGLPVSPSPVALVVGLVIADRRNPRTQSLASLKDRVFGRECPSLQNDARVVATGPDRGLVALQLESTHA